MKTFWKIFYNIVVIPVLFLLIIFIAIFKQKFRTGIRGRKKLFDNLRQKVSKLFDGYKRIWFHVSSLGEFEQSKPLILELRKNYTNIKIIVSFFSPSGYEPSKKYKMADLVTYLPFDTLWNAKKFISMIKPDIAIFIRYDLWPNHIWELKRRKIPILIANATMRSDSLRFLPLIKSFHRSFYNDVNHISVISEDDLKVFNKFKLDIPKISIMGDSRYDQVYKRCTESKSRHLIAENIIKDKTIFVAGSTWDADEKILLEVHQKIIFQINNLLFILVPHEPTDRNLERIENELNDKFTHIRFSELNEYSGEKIIIVDSIGNLMTLYKYASVAFVGGGFKNGVHNVLEPAVYGIPVVFGPNYKNSQEAVNLIKAGGAFSCNDENSTYEILIKLFTDEKFRVETGKISENFVKKHIGATQNILSFIEKLL